MTKKKANNLEEIKNLLEKLSNAHGISGHEKEVRNILEEKIKPYVDEINTDKSARERICNPFLMF